MKTVIIGGGLTGTRIANLLQKCNCDTEIWEKETTIGGRMRTLFGTDAGAQFLTVPKDVSKPQLEFVREMTEAGIIKRFDSNLIKNNPFFTEGQHDYTSPKGLEAICNKLATDTTVSHETLEQVSVLNVDGTVRMEIKSPSTKSFCDILIMTIPVTDLFSVKFNGVSLPKELSDVKYSVRWIAVVTCKKSDVLTNNFVSCYYDNGVIRYSCIESEKRNGDRCSDEHRILLHTTVPFSLSTDDIELAKADILSDFSLKFSSVTPTSFSIHRWDPSQVYKPYVSSSAEAPYVIINDSPLIILTGDAFAPTSNMVGCIEAADKVSRVIKAKL